MHEPKHCVSSLQGVAAQVPELHCSSATQSPSRAHVRTTQLVPEHMSPIGQSVSLAHPRQTLASCKSSHSSGPHAPEHAAEPIQLFMQRGSATNGTHPRSPTPHSELLPQHEQVSAEHEGRCAVAIGAHAWNVTEPHGHVGHISGAHPGVC